MNYIVKRRCVKAFDTFTDEHLILVVCFFFFFYSILLHNTKIFFSYREFAILLFFRNEVDFFTFWDFSPIYHECYKR